MDFYYFEAMLVKEDLEHFESYYRDHEDEKQQIKAKNNSNNLIITYFYNLYSCADQYIQTNKSMNKRQNSFVEDKKIN